MQGHRYSAVASKPNKPQVKTAEMEHLQVPHVPQSSLCWSQIGCEDVATGNYVLVDPATQTPQFVEELQLF